jgi:hypothetical protein
MMGVILTAILLLLSAGAGAQPPDVEWSARFGGDGAECFSDVMETDDGGFLLLGRTESFGIGGGDLWLMKVTDEGELVWERMYDGGGDYDWGSSMVRSQEGGFILLGGTYSRGSGGSDLWLLGVDSSGEMLWDTTFGGPFDDFPSVIKASTSGEFCIAGETGSYGAGSFDAWILWVDAAGNLISQETYGDEHINSARDIELLEDGSIAVLGETFPYGSSRDMWFFMVDDEGTISHETTYGYALYNESAWSLTMDPWGGYISVGTTNAFTGHCYDAWLVRLDEEGTVLWDTVYGWGNDDKGIDACITSEGDFLIGGDGSPSLENAFDFFLFEVDSSGVQEWQTTFGSEYLEEMLGMELTSDGGCIMVGEVFTDNIYDIDAWVVRTGQLNQDPPEPPEELLFQAYPNPLGSGGFLSLRFEMPVEGNVAVELHDLLGRRVAIIRDEHLEAGVHVLEWVPDTPGSSLPAGLYCIIANIDGMRLKRTLVIL